MRKTKGSEVCMDEPQIDDEGRGQLFSGQAKVTRREAVAEGVSLLEVELTLLRDTQVSPKAGQFYFLKSVPSAVEFARPISVYHFERHGNDLVLQFLILQKGEGTCELCHLRSGDSVGVSGPLGNGFTLQGEHLCLCAGGIGVAPIAALASSLDKGTYDFFAGFKSSPFGLDHVRAHHLALATEDGSVGFRGSLPDIFTVQSVTDTGYDTIYACGPEPMLAYVQQVAHKAGVRCFLSVEKRMLCGVGACLGCTIATKEGNKRVCKDGPVFDATIINFPIAKPAANRILHTQSQEGSKVDLSTQIAGVKFKNPVIAASGAFGFGQNYRGFFDVSLLGGICSKGLTIEPRGGNTGERIWEVASGGMNSIGLENPSVASFCQNELPRMLKLGTVCIANLAGSDVESYVQGARLLDATAVDAIELNISCPNVKAGGMAFGVDCRAAALCVRAVRGATSKPLFVKLSPNAADLVAVALACIEAGADALSLINTIQAVAIDIDAARPVFDNVKAGLCGAAVKPIALRMVWDVAVALKSLPPQKRVPIIAVGGISKWQDAVEFIMAGASAVQVGSATFSNPLAMPQIIAELEHFMITHGYKRIADLCAIALP